LTIRANTNINENENTKINKIILGMSDIGNSSNNFQAYIALKYYDKSFECLSEWDKDELVCLSNTIEKINKMNWNQIHTDGGLRYKSIDDSKDIPLNNIKRIISKDIKFYELRVNQKARIVGFRIESTFFLCWLDRNHRICKCKSNK